jgi:hypothetical protein
VEELWHWISRIALAKSREETSGDMNSNITMTVKKIAFLTFDELIWKITRKGLYHSTLTKTLESHIHGKHAQNAPSGNTL